MVENWDLVKDFLAIYREGSVTQAAKVLAVRQSTVSRRLSQLEQALGVQLFFRTQSGVEPTEAAHALMRDAEDAEHALGQMALAAQGKRDEVEGSVRITAPQGIAMRVILPMCNAIFRDYPDLRVGILSGAETLDLSRRQADLALRFVKPSSGDLVAKQVAQLEFRVLAHRDYRRKNRSKNPEKLDWIGIDDSMSLYPEYSWLAKMVKAKPRLVCNDYTVQFEAVLQGYGVALLPRAMRLGQPELVELDLGLALPPPLHLWLVMHRQLRKVRKYSVVWGLLLNELQSSFPGE